MVKIARSELHATQLMHGWTSYPIYQLGASVELINLGLRKCHELNDKFCTEQLCRKFCSTKFYIFYTRLHLVTQTAAGNNQLFGLKIARPYNLAHKLEVRNCAASSTACRQTL